MKKKGFIVATVVVILLAGGIIVGWSVYQKHGTDNAVGGLRSFTDDNFQRDVVEASKTCPVVVDFYAEWCYPCRMLEPTLKELADELVGKVVIGKVNTDRNMISRRFGVQRIPALFIIHEAEIKKSFYGVVPKETIMKALKDLGV
jgi:thioredoxin